VSREVLERLLSKEKKTAGRMVLAPVAGGRKACFNIDNLLYECLLEKQFKGWGIFELRGNGRAMLVREAEAWEKERYAENFTPLTLVLFHRDSSGIWWARDMRRRQFIPVHLVEGLLQFDVITAVFDGSQCWFVHYDPRCDGRRAEHFRKALEGQVNTAGLRMQEVTAQEEELYRMALAVKRGMEEKDREACANSVEKALRAGEGHLMECVEVDKGYRITWRAGGGRTLTTLIDGKLSVISAGLCLAGGDRAQDLTSLASLLSDPAARKK
jgi:hypothetical protein